LIRQPNTLLMSFLFIHFSPNEHFARTLFFKFCTMFHILCLASLHLHLSVAICATYHCIIRSCSCYDIHLIRLTMSFMLVVEGTRYITLLIPQCYYRSNRSYTSFQSTFQLFSQIWCAKILPLILSSEYAFRWEGGCNIWHSLFVA